MKKFTRVMLSVALAASAAFARDAAKPKSEQQITGYLVDVACGSENASHPMAGFADKHDKDCLQMPECSKSGYGILTEDNNLIKLDKQSSDNAKKLIAATDKKDNWKVSATGVLNGDQFSTQSLKLQ